MPAGLMAQVRARLSACCSDPIARSRSRALIISMISYFHAVSVVFIVPSIAITFLHDELNSPVGVLSMFPTLTLGLSSLSVLFSGHAVDRFGAVRCLIFGNFLIALASVLYPLARSLTVLGITHILLAGGFAFGGLMTHVVLLSQWFGKYKGVAVGIFNSSYSLSGAYWPNIVAWLERTYNWRMVYLGLVTTTCWIFGFGSLFFLTSPPVFRERSSDAGAPDQSETRMYGLTLKQSLRRPALYLVSLASASSMYPVMLVLNHFAYYLKNDASIPLTDASLFLGLVFICALVGKITAGVAGAFERQVSSYGLNMICFGTMLLGSLMIFDVSALLTEGRISLTKNYSQLWVFSILFGCGYGAVFTRIQLMSGDIFGNRELGKLQGVNMFCQQTGGLNGVFFSGWLRDWTGSYTVSFTMGVVMSAVALVATVFLGRSSIADHQQYSTVNERSDSSATPEVEAPTRTVEMSPVSHSINK